MSGTPGRLAWLALLVLLVRGLFALALVPPWQQPDEPQHFEAAWAIARSPSFDLRVRTDTAIEVEIFESMARHDWWAHVAETRATKPRSFTEDPYFSRIQVEGVHDAPPVYYAVTAALLRLSAMRDLVTGLYLARACSLVLGLLTLGAVWAGSRQLLPASPEVAAGVIGVVALHPQFLLVATSANPDALVNLFGAVIYWQLACLARHAHAVRALIVIIVAAALAVFTKRSGAPLGVVAAAALVWLIAASLRRGRRALAAGLAVTALAAGVVAALWLAGSDEMERLVREWSHVIRAPLEENPLSVAFLWTFTITLVRSAWLWFGWMAYPAPAGWTAAASAVTVAGLVGVPRLVVRANRQGRQACWRAVGVAGLMAVIQLASILVTFYARGRLAQGRYFFPAIGPWLVLVCLGWTAWWPERLKHRAAAMLVGTVWVLDLVGWWVYVVPTYAR